MMIVPIDSQSDIFCEMSSLSVLMSGIYGASINKAFFRVLNIKDRKVSIKFTITAF